jgi:hypothetical protein
MFREGKTMQIKKIKIVIEQERKKARKALNDGDANKYTYHLKRISEFSEVYEHYRQLAKIMKLAKVSLN